MPGTWKVTTIALDQNHPMRSFKPMQLTEPLAGPDGDFLRSIIDDRPNLIIVELAPPDTSPHHLIHLLKTSAAVRLIPILAVGSSDNILEAARSSGANQVIGLDDWRAKAADLLAGWADRMVSPGLKAVCTGTLHPLAAQGVEAVNQGQYYLAHEFLEEAWMSVERKEGTLYRALLQVSVTYLHLERCNLRGALKMLLRMRQWLDTLPEICRGVDVTRLRQMMATLYQSLEAFDLDQELTPLPEWFQPIPSAPDSADTQPDSSAAPAQET